MRHFASAFALYVLTSILVFAADAPPSDDSLRRLLAATEARKLLEGTLTNIDASMDAGIRQALQGKQMTPREQKAIDEMRAKMAALVRESLAWQTMEPLFIDVYRRSLTQSEVNGMLAFYETEAGKAMVAKMPLIMQNTMQAMQTRMASFAPRAMQIQQETLAKLKAEAGEEN